MLFRPRKRSPARRSCTQAHAASTAAGCGILTHVSNGHAIKIEGNPQHPLNKGKTSHAGKPVWRCCTTPTGCRMLSVNRSAGTKKFDPITWEQVLTQLADRVKAAKPGGVAFYGNLIPDSLFHDRQPVPAGVSGAPPPVLYDTLATFDGRKTLERVTGQLLGPGPNLPMFNIQQADVLYSFGANFNETWLSPVAYGRGYGGIRGRPFGTHRLLRAVRPRLSSTAAVADRWVPVVPGTEGLVAMALGAIIVELGSGKAKDSPAAPLFKTVDIKGMAAESGVSLEKLEGAGAVVCQVPSPPGDPGRRHRRQHERGAGNDRGHGAERHGAGRRTPKHDCIDPPPPDPAFVSATASSFADVKALIDRRAVARWTRSSWPASFIDELPVATKFAGGNGSCAPRRLVQLPGGRDHGLCRLRVAQHSSESWGYQQRRRPVHRPSISGQQPIVTPLYDTRQTSHVFLDLAQRVNDATKKALPWPNTAAFMKESDGRSWWARTARTAPRPQSKRRAASA